MRSRPSEKPRLCRKVGSQISPEVLAKKDTSPVTVADFGSQALICRTLAECFPEDPVIAEEDAVELKRSEGTPILEQVLGLVRAVRSETASGADIMIDAEQVCRWIDHGGGSQYSERFWTLDPIDGTKGFLRGEQYAVALALVVGGRVVVAALACPNLSWQPEIDRLHAGSLGRGAVFHAVREQGAYATVGDDHGGVASEPLRLATSRRVDPTEARFCESVDSGHSAAGRRRRRRRSVGNHG